MLVVCSGKKSVGLLQYTRSSLSAWNRTVSALESTRTSKYTSIIGNSVAGSKIRAKRKKVRES